MRGQGRQGSNSRRLVELLLFAVSPLVAFGASPVLARTLGPAERGQLAALMALGSLLVTASAFGQSEVLSDSLRRAEGRRSASWTIALGLSAVGALVLVIISVALRLPLGVALIAGFFVPLIVGCNLIRVEMIALASTGVLAWQAAMGAVLRLVLLILLDAFSALTLMSALVVTQATSVLSFGVAGWILWQHVRRGGKRSFVSRTTASELRSSLRAGFPILVFAFLTAAILRADIVVLQASSTSAQVGLYATVVAVCEAGLALSAAFKNRIQAACYGGNPAAAVTRELRLMLWVVLVVVSVGEFVAQPFVLVLFGPPFAAAVPAFRVLLAAAFFQMFLDVFQGILTVYGKRAQLVVASTLGAVVAIATAILLSPTLGAFGAAISSLCAYLVACSINGWNAFGALKSASRGVDGHA